MARPKGTRPNTVTTCECGHAGMWHIETTWNESGMRCKIKGCECTEFKHSTINTGAQQQDGDYLRRGYIPGKTAAPGGPRRDGE